jgi:hypothetical protein
LEAKEGALRQHRSAVDGFAHFTVPPESMIPLVGDCPLSKADPNTFRRFGMRLEPAKREYVVAVAFGLESQRE